MRCSWLFAVALAVTLGGCSDTTVSINEVPKLEHLSGAHVTVNREVITVRGLDAVTGVASDRRGSAVRFAVVVGDLPGPPTVPGRVTLRGATYRFESGCARAGFYVEGSTRSIEDAASPVEAVVYEKLAPDAYCEG
jgi:hypothetical protein